MKKKQNPRKLLSTLLFVVMMSFSSMTNAQVTEIDSYEDVLHILQNKNLYPDYTLIAGHRGYWANASENTTASYDAAIGIEIDFIEMDVRITSDDQPAILHDACLDRLTNGTGELNKITLAEAQELFYKKLNTNILTEYNVLSLRDALNHVKGRTIMVNLDIKEVGDKYIETFKTTLEIVEELDMLDQVTVKGAEQIDVIVDALEELELTFDDVNYIPVLYGSKRDLAQRVLDITEIIDETGNIFAVELHYKDDADSLIPYIQTFKDKGVWVGIFSFWPEECAGVQAEVKPVNLCEFEVRHYNFKNNGDLRDFYNDGRGDWDWIFSKGADYIITERPKLMKTYLALMDKRTL